MAILAIAFLILCVVSAAKESKLTGTYKAFGVYGRFTAYMGVFCPMGIVMFIGSFFVESEDTKFPANLVFLVMAAFGALFYWRAYRKCPDFLKKKCIPSMILSGFGVCIKICFFFLGFVWKLTGPQEMQSSTGETVYVYAGNVYNGNGELIGEASADRTSYTKITR